MRHQTEKVLPRNPLTRIAFRGRGSRRLVFIDGVCIGRLTLGVDTEWLDNLPDEPTYTAMARDAKVRL